MRRLKLFFIVSMMRCVLTLFFYFGLLQHAATVPVHASPGTLAISRSPEFAELPALKPRINFWIDIFTRHGKHTQVLHHRNYPGVIFGVYDFTKEAQQMTPNRFESYKKSQLKRHIATVEAACTRLAAGHKPSSVLERAIEQQMRFIPGGNSKYKALVKENLLRTQTGIKEKFAQAVVRSGRYMPLMEAIFAEYGLPVELTRLPFVESSFDYMAYSSVGAAGIWQFMPATGRVFKMRITSAIDERRDPIIATHGSAQYLRQAYRALGNWPLALTSYNHGITGVKRAVKKMGTNNIERIVEHHGKRVLGFASNNFYAEFLAALEVYENHEKYFPGLEVEKPIRFDEIRLGNSYSVAYLAKVLGISVNDIKNYNYAISKATYAGRFKLPPGYVLRVPKGIGSRASNLKTAPPPAVVATSKRSTQSQSITTGLHIVRRGDTLGSIAKRYRTTISAVMKQNRLRGTTIKIGQRLSIPSRGGSVASSKDPRSNLSSARVYKVKRGDNLWRIAKNFGVTVDRLKKANNLKSAELRPGQSLKIP